jgi:microcystin-dependent protein
MDPFLGEIRLTSFGFVPRGWASCEGQLLPINANQALFALLGTQYGGNGVNTFALPDLRGRVLSHVGANAFVGERGGQEAVTLTAAQMPAHSHALEGVTDLANASAPGLALPATKGRGGNNLYGAAGSSNASMHASSVAASGGNQAHNNMQPYTVLQYVIALQGIFPSRN